MAQWNWYVNAVPDDPLAAEASSDRYGVDRSRLATSSAAPSNASGLGTVGAPASAAPSDSQLQKLVKLFPLEIVAVYVALDAFARSASSLGGDDTDAVAIAATGLVALFALLSVPQAFSRFRRVRFSTDRGRQMILIGMGAFVVWSYATGGFAQELGIYQGWLAGLLVVGYLAVVWFYGPKGMVQGV